jgi:hypothetical protein
VRAIVRGCREGLGCAVARGAGAGGARCTIACGIDGRVGAVGWFR